MKKLPFVMILIVCWGCQQKTDHTQELRQQIEKLQTQLSESYKPGFGEFMSSIQVHHAKLWFAGKNKNWALANFEVNEIKEMLEDIPKYCADRPESKLIGMIDPAMDSITQAVQSKDPVLFKKNFILLTNTCNNCHHAAKHAFNVIKIPDTPPVSNQVFKPEAQ